MNFRLLITLLICSLNHLTGQELYGKYLGTERGLLSHECYDINYSEEGYLIVGTQYGPMKYDGEKFMPICLNLPIERRVIYDFEKDPNGKIYLLNSKNELFLLKNDKAILIRPKSSNALAKNVHFNKLHCYKNGIMIYTGKHYNYSFKTKNIRLLSKSDSKGMNEYSYDRSKAFPFRLNTNRPKSQSVRISFISEKKSIIIHEPVYAESRDDVIRIGQTDFVIINMHLFRIHGSSVKHFPYKSILFIESFHDRIWLATYDGLIELDKKGNLIHEHFKGQTIGGVVPLPNGGIAVSLNQKGIFISSSINERTFKSVFPTEIARAEGTILIGNKSGDVFKFDNKAHQLTKVYNPADYHWKSNQNFQKGIRRIEYINKKWYICVLGGVYSLSDNFKKVTELSNFTSSSFNDFFFYQNQLYNIGWGRIETIYQKTTEIPIPIVRCKYRLNDSTLLLGTQEGLFEYTIPSHKLIRSKFLKETYYVSFIQKLSNNEFLIATRYKGIFHIRNGKLVTKHQPPFISLKKILVSNNQLFVAGNGGIYVKMLSGSTKIPWTKIFDGEIENLFLINKTLFICFEDQLIAKQIRNFNPAKKATIVLNQIQLGHLPGKKLPLKIPYDRSLSFDFDILRFDATKLGLYYQLYGKSRKTRYTDGTKISFEALPSGNYHLKVFPVINGKIQFSNPKNYHFTISQPFWESTLFYILISVVIILLLLSIRLVRNLRRKKRIAEQAELESRLNEYKLLAVKAQVNPHFLSNGLAAIQALILKENNELAAQYLAKFSFLMRKVLYYSETQFISIKQELELVDSYLELELLRFGHRFKVQREIKLSKSQLNEFQFPSLLLQPILENAIWHGLKFQEKDPELNISFSINQSKELVVQISDNGPGFNTSNQSEEHLSKGNKLIQERIDTLNLQFQRTVAIMEIISSSYGTTIIFIFSTEIYQSKQA